MVGGAKRSSLFGGGSKQRAHLPNSPGEKRPLLLPHGSQPADDKQTATALHTGAAKSQQPAHTVTVLESNTPDSPSFLPSVRPGAEVERGARENRGRRRQETVERTSGV